MYDIVFKKARVLDGTGAVVRSRRRCREWEHSQDRLRRGRAKTVIDASGKYLSPGFIDAHSHSDLPLVVNPTANSKVMQGVTAEVIGQCGSSGAPRKMGLLPDADEPEEETEGNSPKWNDMASYMKVLEDQGVSVNVVPLVGHGTVRRQVMGVENRAPDAKELSMMKKLVDDAMEQGAFGMSSGLIYVPGRYSKTDEVIELAKVVSKHHGYYFTHLRNEGSNSRGAPGSHNIGFKEFAGSGLTL